MSERLLSHYPSFEEYNHFVVSTRFVKSPGSDWRDGHAAFIDAEMMEFLNQHGPGSLLLMPEEAGIDYRNAPDTLRFPMADEEGDGVWFTFDILDRMGKQPADVCTQALQLHVPDAPPITNFADLEEQAVRYADNIKVINKLGLSGEVDPSIAYTSLRKHPNYVLLRTGTRLSRSLDQGRNDLPPYIATELEPVQEIGQAAGNYLLVLAYVAKARLGISIQDIVRFNMAKLRHRIAYGKENDIHFDASWVSIAAEH